MDRRRWVISFGVGSAAMALTVAGICVFTCWLPWCGCRGASDPLPLIRLGERWLAELAPTLADQDLEQAEQLLEQARGEVHARRDLEACAAAGEALSLISQVIVSQTQASGYDERAVEEARRDAVRLFADGHHEEAGRAFALVEHLVLGEIIRAEALLICDFDGPVVDCPHVADILSPSAGISYSLERDVDRRSRVLKINYDSTKRDFDFLPIRMRGLHVGEHRYLVFAVRGDPSIDFFKVELKEAETPGIPGAYVRELLDGTWQWVAVPLDRFSLPVPGQPNELVFVFEAWRGARSGTIRIDDIYISRKEIGLADLAPVDEPPPEITLDEIQRRAVLYFWEQANRENGLIKDRSAPDSPSSIAAVGFGLTSLIIGVERGWLDEREVYDRILTTLRFFLYDVEEVRGFFYHFLEMETGRRYHWPDGDPSELSSIDTALFLAGVLFAGQYFEGTEVAQLAQDLYKRADWEWMLDGGDTLRMCWTPEDGFCEPRWADYSEHMVMYLLAIGSPTHPIPPESWHAWARPVVTRYGLQYVHNVYESLFVYQYSHAYVDFRDKRDDYADYWQNSINAIRANREFVLQHMDEYSTYGPNIWGLTAGDGPDGYKNYGAAPANHDGTIAPYGMISSLPFVPERAQRGIETMAERYGTEIWGPYGFTSAFNKDRDWYSDQYIGIDQGIIVLMVENYQTGFVWKVFMQIEAIQRATQQVGFVEASAAVFLTPREPLATQPGEHAIHRSEHQPSF